MCAVVHVREKVCVCARLGRYGVHTPPHDTVNALPNLSSLLHNSSSFSRICAPLLTMLQACKFCASVLGFLPHSQSFASRCVDAFPPSFPCRLTFSSFPTTHTISAWCLLILDGHTPSQNLPPAIQSPTIVFFGIHPSFRSDLLRQILHDHLSLLLLHLFRRCRLYSLNKEKNLAKQSFLHFLILQFLFLRTLLHSNGAPLPLKASLLLSSTLYLLVQNFLFHFSANFFQP